MADTSQQQPLSEPHTNGVVDGLTEDEKSKMRPADIDADMREMERRKRVEMMMNSRLFREELERIIETQMKDGAGPSGLLQQISEMMGAQGARLNGNVFKNSNCVLPINDIRGVESMGYAKGEKLLRCKLSAVFRLLDLYGWTQGVGGQITARLNQDQEHFLVNPYGLLYHEITASSLVKVDMQGTIVEQGTTNFGVHVTGFQLHSTIHAARPDIKCIIHITTPSVTAISSLKCGLLPIGQESIVIGEVSTHQYIGGSIEPEEKEKIARNLGPINKVMMLTNRGALCCGESVEEAFFNVYNMVMACETQLKLMPAGLDNLSLISEETKKAIFEASRKPPTPQQTSQTTESSVLAEKLEKRWRIGGSEFEALMRMLDNAGFRTGYIYRNPLVKGEPPRPRNDVEVPPAVSSLGYLLEEEELFKQGLWKGGRKGTDRSRWLNSPNVYQKVEILETGTPDPKKITKWVSDGSPTHSSTPVKIESALQFVPKNTNPKEFKQLQQQIKDYRRADKISAGPQSHILEGVTWEEAKKMQDATISGTGEQVVLVGAASKGIIQRGFQHNAMVYKTPYAKNPFDAITDQELDQYKKDIERKQKGDPYDESQSESEALSSFNVSRATHESSTAKSPIQSPVSVTSETEEESRDEPRVLRIETKQVPAPSQPEVVLSDDRDWSGRYCSESEIENDRESRNEVYVARMRRDCRVSDIYQSQPRLEIARSNVIAERMTPIIIPYTPSAIAPNVSSLINCKSRFFENIPNSVQSEDEGSKEASGEGTRRDNLKQRSESIPPDGQAEEEDRRTLGCNTVNANSTEQIADLVNRIDLNAPSSKTSLSTLSRSDFKISTKYSLDSADMSLIYSLTPQMDSDPAENADDMTLRGSLSSLPSLSEHKSGRDHVSSRSSEEKQRQRAWAEKRRTLGETREAIWLDPFDDDDGYELCKIASPELAQNLSSDSDQSEIHSNCGSDLLELPADTVLELLETNGDYFRNGISNSANEIIAELDANDTYANISSLVAEILQRVCTICSMQFHIECKPLRSSSPIVSSPLSILRNGMLKENAKRRTVSPAERLDSDLLVVREIVYHVIDANETPLDETLNYSSKKAKDTANVELKEARNSSINEQPEILAIDSPSGDNDELKKGVCQSVEFPLTVTSISTTEMDRDEPGKTEAEAILEFCTLAMRKSTGDADDVLELNFRIERNNNAKAVADRENPVENSVEKRRSSESNPSSNTESTDFAERDVSSANSSVNEDADIAELPKQCGICDLTRDCNCYEMCDECIYCDVNPTQEYLPPIFEETETSGSLKETPKRLSLLSNDEARQKNRADETFTCSNSSENGGSDKELLNGDLENAGELFSKISQLEDEATFFNGATILYSDASFTSLEIALESTT